MDIYDAPFPHCDSDVLHAPDECVHCDHYPSAQYARQLSDTDFTGHSTPGFRTCPSEVHRPLETINRWPGNRARKPGEEGDLFSYSYTSANGESAMSMVFACSDCGAREDVSHVPPGGVYLHRCDAPKPKRWWRRIFPR